MKKKILAMGMLICMLCSLVACGGNKEVSVSGETQTGSDQETQESQEQQADVAQTGSSVETVTVQEQVLVDQEGIKITAIESEITWIEQFNEYMMSVLAENNSGVDVYVSVSRCIINGYEIDGPIICSNQGVANGEESNVNIFIDPEKLEDCGITTIAEVELQLEVREQEPEDPDEAFALYTDWVSVQTSAAGYVQAYDDSGEVLYDDSGIRIIYKGVKKDSFSGNVVILYMENNTENEIHIYADDTSVDGFMADTILAATVPAGKRTIRYMSFMDSEFKEAESLGTIETKFSIMDYEHYDKNITTPAVTIQCQ